MTSIGPIQVVDCSMPEPKRIKIPEGCNDSSSDNSAAGPVTQEVAAAGTPQQMPIPVAVFSQHNSSLSAAAIVASTPLSLPSFSQFSATVPIHSELLSPPSVAYGNIAFSPSPAHAQPTESFSYPHSAPIPADCNRPGVYYGGPPKGLFRPTPPSVGSSNAQSTEGPL
jgi:hypothetical protein